MGIPLRCASCGIDIFFRMPRHSYLAARSTKNLELTNSSFHKFISSNQSYRQRGRPNCRRKAIPCSSSRQHTMERALSKNPSYRAMYEKMYELHMSSAKRIALGKARLTTFTCFAGLPVELQIAIWRAFFVLSIQDPFILYVFLEHGSQPDLCQPSSNSVGISTGFVPLSPDNAGYLPDLDHAGRTDVHNMLLASKLSCQIAREELIRLYIETECEYEEQWKDMPWNYVLLSQHGQDEIIVVGARKVVFKTPTSGLLYFGH